MAIRKEILYDLLNGRSSKGSQTHLSRRLDLGGRSLNDIHPLDPDLPCLALQEHINTPITEPYPRVRLFKYLAH
jgi:hypothetical protein